MAQIWIYISYYLAAGAVIGAAGMLLTRTLGRAVGKLEARIGIAKGEFNIDKVNKEIAEVEADFRDNSTWWILWWSQIVIFWPKSLVLFTKIAVQNARSYRRLTKELKRIK